METLSEELRRVEWQVRFASRRKVLRKVLVGLWLRRWE